MFAWQVSGEVAELYVPYTNLPLAQLGGIALQELDALPGLLVRIRLGRRIVLGAMPGQHRLRRRFELVGLANEIRARAAALLGRMARQLHAIDREHLATDQALSIADQERLGEDLRDLVAQRADEACDGREVGLAVAGQGDENAWSRHMRLIARLLMMPCE